MKAAAPTRKRLKFYSYKVSTGPYKGELLEVDLKVEGKEIKCTYTKLKTHYHDATLTFRNRKA